MSDPIGLPADPGDWRLLAEAYADGELDAAMVLAVERRLQTDPALAAHHERIMALKSALRSVRPASISPSLEARIAALAETGATATVTALPIRPRKSFDWRQMAASIVVTALLVGGATHWLSTGPASDSLIDDVASGHRRALLAASPIDIASSDRHTVKPWLDARIGLSPPANDLTADGFMLLGGRVEVIGGKPVPALAYRHNEHLITLVALPRGAGGPASSPAEMSDLSADGFSMVRFGDTAFTYFAISDMDRTELDNFARRFRASAAGG